MANRLLSAIEKNKYVLGPFMKLDSATVVEIAGLAGFDFVILDTEHGPLDISEVENLIRAAHLHDMCAIVRVGENDPLMIGRALDIGADGVQIPQISNKDARLLLLRSFTPEEKEAFVDMFAQQSLHGFRNKTISCGQMRTAQ